MKLQEIMNSDSGILWLSKEINHGDWPFRFAVRLQYTDYFDSEWAKTAGQYHVEVVAVSPVAAENKLESAFESCYDVAQLSTASDEAKCEVLIDYGTVAHLWQKTGNNKAALLREARVELKKADMMFGFYMDRAQNAIGDTGWDWIAGNICAAIERSR